MWFILNIIQAILIALVTAICSIPTILFSIFGATELAYMIPRKIWAPILLFLVGGRVKVLNGQNIPKNENVIFVSNHQSHFDIVVLFKALPFPIYFIAKKELKKIPFLGWGIAAMGMIFIDRSNNTKAMESMKKAGELIKAGKNVIAFPEGTRSKTGEIGMFRKGTFVIAQNGEINIVPIAIDGTIKFHRSGKFGFRPGTAYINIGEKITYREFESKPPEDFANYTQKLVKKLYDEIQTKK